jgi:hypothetical protein
MIMYLTRLKEIVFKIFNIFAFVQPPPLSPSLVRRGISEEVAMLNNYNKIYRVL